MKFLLPLMFFSLSLFAQVAPSKYLYIMRGSTMAEERLETGMILAVKYIETDNWIKGEITDFDSTGLSINYRRFAFHELAAVRTYNELGYIFGQALFQGAILFSGVGVANGLINGDEPLVSPLFMGVTAGGGLLGGLIALLSRETFRFNQGWHLKVFDFSKLEP